MESRAEEFTCRERQLESRAEELTFSERERELESRTEELMC